MMPPRLITLTFHGIGTPQRPLDHGEDDVWVREDRFLSLLDAAAGRDDVGITFDDGNASDIEIALPALRERGLGATFFVVAGRLGEPGFIDAGGVRRLAAGGMKIGCHGMRHRPWRGLDERALHEELVQAKARLEEIIEQPIAAAACPFGSYDRDVLRALRRGGYLRAYTSDRGATHPEAFVQPRNSVGPSDDLDLLQRIVPARGRPSRALHRHVKLAVKRWR
jgi:peptidoglycan/xylan/chitin deacetylase (PgdA/CDA1 family)